MLNITFRDGERFDWQLNGTIEEGTFDSRDVTMVQADGGELDYITKQFHNLPYHSGNVVAWFGDLAKMVADRIYQVGRKNEKFGKGRRAA